MNNKEEIRKEILKKRHQIAQEKMLNWSHHITEALFQLGPFQKSLQIMCYVDFRNEVSTRALISQALSMGKRVSVPYIPSSAKEANEMIAAEILSLEEDLETGKYGILCPRKETLIEVPPGDLQCVIIPGVAFDLKKNRIGYGAGFYDRFLSKVSPQCFKVGIAYDFQVIEKIPSDSQDIPLDMILTEKRRII